MIQVTTDEQGDAHRRAGGARAAGEGRRPKFIYSVPSFQNPAGVTLSAERRIRLVELARRYELLLCEDNPYGLLRFEGEPQRTLYSLDGGDYVIYLGTFEDPLAWNPRRYRGAAGCWRRSRWASRRPTSAPRR